MILEKIILKDFLTYENLVYHFTDKPLLIQGENLTDEGQKSNGSGKSGMQTGIEFAITASNSRGVRDSELITYGQKCANVQLIASCNVRKERIHIDWKINLKGSNVLTLLKQPFGNDWEQVSFSNVNDGKKYVLDWFAISKEDLFNYYLINNTRFKSFFKSSNKEKVDLINRFSDASIITGLDEIDNSELESKESNLQAEIQRLEGKKELCQANLVEEMSRDFKSEMGEKAEEFEEEIEDLNEQIEDLKDSIEKIGPKKQIQLNYIKEEQQEIIDLKERKESLIKSIEAKTETLNSIQAEVVQASQKVSDFDLTDWEAERADFKSDIKKDKLTLKEERKSVDDLSSKIEKVQSTISKINVILSGSITCPKCSHEFVLNGDIDELKDKKQKLPLLKSKFELLKKQSEDSIESIKKSIDSIESSISEINKKEQIENEALNSLKEALSDLRDKLGRQKDLIASDERKMSKIDTEVSECNQAISQSKIQISKWAQEKTSLESDIKSCENEIKVIEEKIKSLKPEDNSERIKNLKSEIKGYDTQMDEKRAELTTVGDEIYKRNQWANNFKQFRMYLANQSLEAMEYHSNRYLNDMGSDLRLKLEGFKTLANGKIKEEITANILRGDVRSFGSFSGGERGRLLFASILANRYMINQTHPYGGLDFLSIDEVFEGVDGIGLKKLIKSAKNLGIAVMIITHVTDEETSSDVLKIVKRNGVSQIEQ